MTAADAVAAYRRNLPRGEVGVVECDRLDRVGVPVRIANLQFADGYLWDGFGYGATPDDALAGAFGELTEDTRCDEWMRAAPRAEGGYARVRDRYGDRGVVDPVTLVLPAGSDYTPDRPLVWVEGRRWPTGEPVLVPEEFAAVSRSQLRGRRPLTQPITNGQGAGLSREQALAHGLLELLQRDGNGLCFRALDQGVAVDLDAVRDPRTVAVLDRLRGHGIDPLVKLATTEFGLTNLYAVGDDPAADLPIKVTACGEAVHPDRETALLKALLEFAAARSRKAFMHGPLDPIAAIAPPGYLDRVLPPLDYRAEEPRALAGMLDWLAVDAATLRGRLAGGVFAVRRRVPFSSLPTVAPEAVRDPAARLNLLLDRLAPLNLELVYLDFSPPGGEVFACKAVVPGLEVETMSYHRLGERGVRKLLARGDRLAGVGPPPAGALPVRLTAAATGRLGGPAWLDPAAVAAAVGPLYPLYREPSSHAARKARAAGFVPAGD